MPFKEPVVKTMRAQFLGDRMRELRHHSGLTLKFTSEYLDRDHSALARYERAEWPFRRDHVLALLDIYQVADGKERSALLHLCDNAWRTHEWDIDFADELPERTYPSHTWLESRAETICVYHTHHFPDLVQTPAYAAGLVQMREKTKARMPDTRQARQVDRLTQRQRDFEAGTNKLNLIIDDAVLHHAVGAPHVMREQLHHLGALARRPRINVRVLPAQATLSARVHGSFQLFLMPDPYPEVGFIENLAGHIYVEAPQSKRFVQAYDQLWAAALDPAESAELITKTAYTI